MNDETSLHCGMLYRGQMDIHGQEWDDQVLVSRKDLERLQQVVRTTHSLLPEILNRDVLTALANAQSLEHGNSLSNIKPPQGGDIIMSVLVCLSVCLSVYKQNYTESS